MWRSRHLVLVSTVVFLACGGTEDDVSQPSRDSAADALTAGANSGTALTLTAGEVALACASDGSGATATVGFTAVSTGAADAAVLTASVDGAAEVTVGEIAAGTAGWSFEGRTKTATGSVSLTLTNGQHSVVLCATQNGGRGRLEKRACTSALSVLVECAKVHCNQGLGNGSEGCDPGNSNHKHGSNDEGGAVPGQPGRGGRK